MLKEGDIVEIFTYLKRSPSLKEPSCQDNCIYEKIFPSEPSSEYCFRNPDRVKESMKEAIFYKPSVGMHSCALIVKTMKGEVEHVFAYFRGKSEKEGFVEPACKDGCIYRKIYPFEEMVQYCFE